MIKYLKNTVLKFYVGRTIPFTSIVILNEAQRSEEPPCINTGVYTGFRLPKQLRPAEAGRFLATLRHRWSFRRHAVGITIIIYLLSAANSFSQNIEFDKKLFKDDKKLYKEAAKELKIGDEFFEVQRYYIALGHYNKANEFNPENAFLNFKIGKCILRTIQKVESIDYLEKAYRLNPNVDGEIRYLLGQAYQLNYQWDKAISEYKAYKNQLFKWDDRNRNRKMIALLKKIDECKTGKKLVRKPVRVFIDNLSKVNSVYAEYNPLISADESVMLFTSRRSNTTGGGTKEEGFDYEYPEDVYISYKKDGKWTAPLNIGEPINTDEHDATVGLSPDGQQLFVYRFKPNDGGDIYVCELRGDKWSKPKRLGKNINTSYHESSASFSYDGKTMYFVTDKPGGLGGRDIYISKINKKGKWEEAKNIGSVINTQYNEEGVFMHPDGKTLYFSSQGHNTMGGYDIFRTVYENGRWSEPKNMGYPINTPDDDVFFVVSASGKHGYYTSVKSDGFGEKDIYMITILGPEKPFVLNTEDQLLASLAEPVSETVIEPAVDIITIALTILKGTVKDAITLDPVEANIELIDNEKNKIIANFRANAKTGKYLVSLPSGKNYGIAVKAEDYLFHSENFIIPSSAGYNEITKDILLKKVAVGVKIILKNIFFDFDKATLRPESASELERLVKLLNDVPTLQIEISGHTDNKGSDDYNQKLSHKRARSVVEDLISKGISGGRLEYKGYGESAPIASNDTEEERQMNRRTEFKVLKK